MRLSCNFSSATVILTAGLMLLESHSYMPLLAAKAARTAKQPQAKTRTKHSPSKPQTPTSPDTSVIPKRGLPKQMRLHSKKYLPLTPETKVERDAQFKVLWQRFAKAQQLYTEHDLAGAEQNCFDAIAAAPKIQGQKQHIPFVPRLLGRIYLAEGQNGKALVWLRSAYANTADRGIDLDVALAYSRLGDYENAKRFYSNSAITQYHVAGKDIDPQDLPGTDSPQALEASILLARGMDAFFEARKEDATDEFIAASRLASDNPLIHYFWGYALVHLGRGSEAAEHFMIASQRGHGALVEDADKRFRATQSASNQ